MADAHALLEAKGVWRARGQGATKYRVSFINAAQGAVISLQEAVSASGGSSSVKLHADGAGSFEALLHWQLIPPCPPLIILKWLKRVMKE